MIRRPPRSTLDRSSAASDVYKRQGLRGAVGIFLASIPLLAGLPDAWLYFNVAFVVVLVSLLVQGWSLAAIANRLGVAVPRKDPNTRRIQLDLPGQLEYDMVGYRVAPLSLIHISEPTRLLS